MEREKQSSVNSAALNQEVKAIWNHNAVFWDQRMGEGNYFQRELVGPTSERLLEIQPGEMVLEIACGNGVFSRRLAALGARVIASDLSEKLIELAQARTVNQREQIEYRILDATSEEQLLALGVERFDAAVCNMGMMDMSEIDPLLRALRQLLKPEGRFVFSIMHPCFNARSVLGMEVDDSSGELVATHSVKISKYLSYEPQRGVAMRGQPISHYYFHRSLQMLFNSCFQAGFVLDGLEEPAFHPTEEQRAALSWLAFEEIPPVLVTRWRPGR